MKPASDTPACMIRFTELLLEGGIPEGVVNVVTGSGNDVGHPLVEHPRREARLVHRPTETGVGTSPPGPGEA